MVAGWSCQAYKFCFLSDPWIRWSIVQATSGSHEAQAEALPETDQFNSELPGVEFLVDDASDGETSVTALAA